MRAGELCAKLGLNKTELQNRMPRQGEAPFDSQRKMMSTLHTSEEGLIQFTKGAPDEVLKLCTHILTEEGVQPLTDGLREQVLSQNKAMADRALRVAGRRSAPLGCPAL